MRRVLAWALIVGGCTSSSGDGGTDVPQSPLGAVPPHVQRPGDAAAGYNTLINSGYVSCGIPERIFSDLLGPAPESLRLPGRTGKNATLPFYATSFFREESGVEIVSTNCLLCHAGRFNGELIVGLGAETRDFSENLSMYAGIIGGFDMTHPERMEWSHWNERVAAIAPYSITHTIGANPADNLTAAIWAHLDPVTLEWSDELRMDPPETYVVPSSPPPWWWMRKKNAMFYTASGRGDHTRFMMLASSLCNRGLEETEAIHEQFDDVRAWISTLEPPPWPFETPDPALVSKGERVFEKTCSRCHGTYGPSGVYPNLAIALDEVGTDPEIAGGSTTGTNRFLQWFEDSWYANDASLAPAPGYIAPPLDAVWATAPYLHNGSVPTIEALLDSPSRPRYWIRTTYDSTVYDRDALGWPVIELADGKNGTSGFDPWEIYDTDERGYSNEGHTFGDALSPELRRAVLEYLKTL